MQFGSSALPSLRAEGSGVRVHFGNDKKIFCDAEYLRLGEKMINEIVSSLDLPFEKANQICKLLTEKILNTKSQVTDPLATTPSKASILSLANAIQHIFSSRREQLAPMTCDHGNQQPHDFGLESGHAAVRYVHDQIPHVTPEKKPPRAVAQRYLDAFLEGHNKIVYVSTPADAQLQFNCLYEDPRLISHAWACQTFLRLALGAQILEEVNEKHSISLYESGKGLIEDGFEENEGDLLWVVQAMLLSVLYHIGSKPNTSRMYLGTAIRIAQSHHLDKEHYQHLDLSEADRAEWRQIMLSAVFLDNWLAAALGRVPLVNEYDLKHPILRDIHTTNGLYDCSVQTKFAQWGVLVGRILGEIYTAEDVCLSVYDKHMKAAESWIAHLPSDLRISTDSQDWEARSKEDKVAISLLEMSHCALVMLLTRPLLLQYVTLDRGQSKSANALGASLQSYAHACVYFALRISQIGSKLVKQRLISNKCWVVISLSFNASLILLLSLLGNPSESGTNGRSFKEVVGQGHETSGLDSITAVLEYCSEKDLAAQQRLRAVKTLREQIITNVPVQICSSTKSSFAHNQSTFRHEDIRRASLPPNMAFFSDSALARTHRASISAPASYPLFPPKPTLSGSQSMPFLSHTNGHHQSFGPNLNPDASEIFPAQAGESTDAVLEEVSEALSRGFIDPATSFLVDLPRTTNSSHQSSTNAEVQDMDWTFPVSVQTPSSEASSSQTTFGSFEEFVDPRKDILKNYFDPAPRDYQMQHTPASTLMFDYKGSRSAVDLKG
ncbi:MAG: hypothetical protein M1819_006700 [Sarea resinae]|nr:MAG: hypothetical protein M1819_006700 [Sarea resinae]